MPASGAFDGRRREASVRRRLTGTQPQVIIAIDGPAGAGKSTVARRLAERLGFHYLDTGAMYRALAWLALERSASLDDGDTLGELAEANPVAFDAGRVVIAGTDVTDAIREPRIDRSVSTVAAHEAVRTVMRRRQRDLAATSDAVVEGRDIGRIVCPDAEVKVWLQADHEERARRRGAQHGETAELAADLERRDELDAAQMQPAADAERIDTTALTVEEVVARIERLVWTRSTA